MRSGVHSFKSHRVSLVLESVGQILRETQKAVETANPKSLGAKEHEGVTNHQPTPFTILSHPHVMAFLAHEIDGFTHYLYQEWVYLKIGNSENPMEYHKKKKNEKIKFGKIWIY